MLQEQGRIRRLHQPLGLVSPKGSRSSSCRCSSSSLLLIQHPAAKINKWFKRQSSPPAGRKVACWKSQREEGVVSFLNLIPRFIRHSWSSCTELTSTTSTKPKLQIGLPDSNQIRPATTNRGAQQNDTNDKSHDSAVNLKIHTIHVDGLSSHTRTAPPVFLNFLLRWKGSSLPVRWPFAHS